MSSTKITSTFAAILLIGGLVTQASPASAGSFCYEKGRHSTSSSYKRGVIVVRADVNWSSLYNCTNQRIGVKVYSYTVSYSGGVNGTGRANSKHGITTTGVTYTREGECCGISVSSDAVKRASNFPRSASGSKSGGWEVYSVRDKEGVDRSFTETSVGADIQLPFNDFPFGPNFRGSYNIVNNVWLTLP
jgi:hypothetical protein